MKFARKDFDKLRGQEEEIDIRILAKFLFALGYITVDERFTPRKLSLPKYAIQIPNVSARMELAKLIHEANAEKFKWDVKAESLLDQALLSLLDPCTHGK